MSETLDLSKLSPAPWEATSGSVPIGDTGDYEPWVNVDSPECVICRLEETVDFCDGKPDWHATAEFIALARNAFEIMMRRGWGVNRYGDGWRPFVRDRAQFEMVRWMNSRGEEFCWPDPFTALVEADAWWRKHEGDVIPD